MNTGKRPWKHGKGARRPRKDAHIAEEHRKQNKLKWYR
mgnify:FL=1